MPCTKIRPKISQTFPYLYLWYLLITTTTTTTGGTTPSTPNTLEDLPYELQLTNRKNEYLLTWGYDNHSVTFEVHVRTRGWVGLGLAPNRNMLGADLVIGWVDDSGVAHLHDRYSSNFSRPEVDPVQDWTLLAGRQNATHTTLRFSRAFVTCDPLDNDIRNDTMGVIWAYHPRDPDDPLTVHYHGRVRRGGRSVQLLTHAMSTRRGENSLPRDAFNIDFAMPNVLLPGEDTAYLCHAFPAPRLGRKHHVIRVEPILQRPHSGLVHHMILYGCYHDVDMTSVTTPTECFQANVSPMLMLCNAVFAGWAIGGEVFVLPEYAGLPLGDSTYPTMMVLQIHYDNVERRADIRDASGIRLWMTSYLRQHDAAFIQTGVTVDGFQAIPPQSAPFTSQGHCLPECLTEVMRDKTEEIRVFGALLHTHLTGVAVRVRHFRGGHELPPIVADEHYDFNFQETRMIPEEVVVLPGDHLITECGYHTDNRLIWGGLSTREEMCIAYLLYYPAIPLTNCDSRPTTTAALSFLDVQFSRNRQVIWPKSLRGQTYRDVLARMEWDEEARSGFQQSVTSGQVRASCKMGNMEYKINDKNRNLPEILTQWRPKQPEICLPKHQVEGHTSTGNIMKHNAVFLWIVSLLNLSLLVHFHRIK